LLLLAWEGPAARRREPLPLLVLLLVAVLPAVEVELLPPVAPTVVTLVLVRGVFVRVLTVPAMTVAMPAAFATGTVTERTDDTMGGTLAHVAEVAVRATLRDASMGPAPPLITLLALGFREASMSVMPGRTPRATETVDPVTAPASATGRHTGVL